MSTHGAPDPRPEQTGSFRKWIVANYARLVGYARNLTRGRDPEDRVQILYASVQEHPSRFSGRIRRYTAFAFQMLRNLVSNEARRRSRERPLGTSGDEVASPEQTPAESIADDEDRALLARVAGYLNETDKRWLDAVQEGLDGPTLAERFGVSHDMARKRKQGIRQRLADGVTLLQRIDALGSPPGSLREQINCLRYVGRLKPAEIAQRKQCSVAFVRQLLNEAATYLPAQRGGLDDE